MHAHEPVQMFHPRGLDNMEDMYHIQFKDELLIQIWLELFTTKILDAQHQWMLWKMKFVHNSSSMPYNRLTL